MHQIETNVGLDKIEEMEAEPSVYNTSVMDQFTSGGNPMTDFAKQWGNSKQGRQYSRMRMERE